MSGMTSVPIFPALNASAAFVAGLVLLFIGRRLGRTRLEDGALLVSFAHSILWVFAGAGLIAIGLREYAGLFNLPVVNLFLFFAIGYFVAGISAPITFQGIYLYTKRERLAGYAAIGIFFLSLISPSLAIWSGVTPTITEFGTEFLLQSSLPIIFFHLFTVIPVIIFSLLLIKIGRRLETASIRRRAVLVPLAVLFFIFLFVVDGIPPTGPGQLAVRLLYFVDALLVHIAYLEFGTKETFSI